MPISHSSIERIRRATPCWIAAFTLLTAAARIDAEPTVLSRTAELALRASGTVQEHEAKVIQSILDTALRGLQPDPAALELARRWGGEEIASPEAWDALAKLQFTGQVHALTTAEILAHKDHPVITIYDSDLVIDLVTGPAIALLLVAEDHVELWRNQVRSGRRAMYVPSAGNAIAMDVEAIVAEAFGFGDAVAAAAHVQSANVRYGFTSYGGAFPADFQPDTLQALQELAWARELPGAELMPQTGA
jgi:hypothetical protein